mmetsp:Transcript_14317/g.41999  ORF Transcript_14317/g.41999 Transcript_14317/m.41999 type:complete len:243 (-) Transcript_14317:428-1156(-)
MAHHVDQLSGQGCALQLRLQVSGGHPLLPLDALPGRLAARVAVPAALHLARHRTQRHDSLLPADAKVSQIHLCNHLLFRFQHHRLHRLRDVALLLPHPARRPDRLLSRRRRLLDELVLRLPEARRAPPDPVHRRSSRALPTHVPLGDGRRQVSPWCTGTLTRRRLCRCPGNCRLGPGSGSGEEADKLEHALRLQRLDPLARACSPGRRIVRVCAAQSAHQVAGRQADWSRERTPRPPYGRAL